MLGEGSDDFLAQFINQAPAQDAEDVANASVDMTLLIDGLTPTDYWQYDGAFALAAEAVEGLIQRVVGLLVM